jgi:hypothetical protein
MRRRIVLMFGATRLAVEKMRCVDVTIALTLLLSFGAFLFFPTVNAPPVFARVAIGLCAAEFVTVIVWFAGSSCIVWGCGTLSRAARTLATLDIPALTGLMLVAATVYGLRVARSW